MDKVPQNLASNVITLRKKKKLTQEQLAKLAGATRASVALIESGSSNPTLEVLLKLSTALQVSIDELMTPPRAEVKHIPANEVPLDKKSKKGLTIRKLLPDKIRATEIDELVLESGAILPGTPHVEGTKEYFTCLEGEIIINVLGQSHTLKAGDVFAFAGDKPHAYKNLSKSRARGISVVLFNPL